MTKETTLKEDREWIRSLFADYGEVPYEAIGYALGLLPRLLDGLDRCERVMQEARDDSASTWATNYVGERLGAALE